MGTSADLAHVPSISVEGQLGIEIRWPMWRDSGSMPWALLFILSRHGVTEGFQSPPTDRDGVARPLSQVGVVLHRG